MDPYFMRGGAPAEFEPTAVCRHGDHPIKQLESGIWVDEEGFTTCVKAPTLGKSAQVLHTPLPEGLKEGQAHE